MTSRAHAEFDPMALGVRIAVVREYGGREREILQWPTLAIKRYDPVGEATQATDEDWLRLPEDDARAIYEALADHFGHAGHDTRALRKDYDAERGRVDRLIGHLIGGAR